MPLLHLHMKFCPFCNCIWNEMNLCPYAPCALDPVPLKQGHTAKARAPLKSKGDPHKQLRGLVFIITMTMAIASKGNRGSKWYLKTNWEGWNELLPFSYISFLLIWGETKGKSKKRQREKVNRDIVTKGKRERTRCCKGTKIKWAKGPLGHWERVRFRDSQAGQANEPNSKPTFAVIITITTGQWLQ